MFGRTLSLKINIYFIRNKSEYDLFFICDNYQIYYFLVIMCLLVFRSYNFFFYQGYDYFGPNIHTINIFNKKCHASLDNNQLINIIMDQRALTYCILFGNAISI